MTTPNTPFVTPAVLTTPATPPVPGPALTIPTTPFAAPSVLPVPTAPDAVGTPLPLPVLTVPKITNDPQEGGLTGKVAVLTQEQAADPGPTSPTQAQAKEMLDKQDSEPTTPSEPYTLGTPDAWKLLAHHSHRGTSRTTRALDIPGVGILIQVEVNSYGEQALALQFVPGAQLSTPRPDGSHPVIRSR